MGDVRPAAVAGTWYPLPAARLAAAVDAYLASVAADPYARCPKAIVVPHAGLIYSGPVAAGAYRQVSGCAYDAVILVGPSHFIGFRGVSVWPRGSWETPLGAVPVAEELSQALVDALPEARAYPAPHAREHSLEMQLPFVARLLPGVPIVPLLIGYQERDVVFALGDALACILRTPERARTLLIASSDLSHYEDAATASRLDGVVLRHLEALDADGLMTALEREPGHACGGGAIVSVLRAASRLGAVRARVLRYADSGDVSGDKSSVVGYAAAAVW
jgi:AmmeMemoRadiSam system protein B